jgi:hypothetical protein
MATDLEYLRSLNWQACVCVNVTGCEVQLALLPLLRQVGYVVATSYEVWHRLWSQHVDRYVHRSVRPTLRALQVNVDTSCGVM